MKRDERARMFTIEWSKEAAKRLDRLHPAVAEAIKKRVSLLGSNPSHFGKRLHHLGVWSLRVGDYRVLYTLDWDTSHIRIVTILHRRTAYDRS